MEEAEVDVGDELPMDVGDVSVLPVVLDGGLEVSFAAKGEKLVIHAQTVVPKGFSMLVANGFAYCQELLVVFDGLR